MLKVKQNNFFSPAFPRLNTHKSFHHNFEFLQLFGYFSFLVVSFFDSFTPNLPCCVGFRVIFDLGSSKPEEKLLEPRIINIESLEAHTSFHLEFFRSTLELIKFQKGFFDPSKCWFVPHTVLELLYTRFVLLDPLF